ncbi:hypothetical protein KP509_17G085000 [Ceratopteris richardii]|uniref:Exostosin GT47 domain-containing protein n=1 Tax=Ceratopteris richardii TaxID=49495 RepID=A0A8T2SWZ1_CERRI|nr:hypothetical protein KP509_17G085000 [Ceratopteris richardii]
MSALASVLAPLGADKGRVIRKNLRFACLLVVLFILLATFYNACPSCNSDVVWLSIRLPASSSSLVASDIGLLSSTSIPCLVGCSNNSLYRVKDPGPNIPSKGTRENVLNHQIGVEVSADRRFHRSYENNTQENASYSDKELQDQFLSVDFSKAHESQHTKHHRKYRSRRVHILEQNLWAARQAIFFSATKVDGDLYAPIYHNVSMFAKSYELMERMLKIYIYKEGVRPLVHIGPTIGIYASEGRFIHQLESSKVFVTGDHHKAHLFFMPYSVTNAVRRLYVQNSHDMQPITRFITTYVSEISMKYPYWNQSGGADHFFVSCHDWALATSRGHKELRQNAIKVVCNADAEQDFVVSKDVSLPEITLRAAKPPTKLGGLPIRKRPYLAFFAGQVVGRVRPLLLQHWHNKDPDMKIYEHIPSNVSKKTSYIRHMKMSKYCICPMGHEVNSPRIVEAIYYDCVPVIIADNFMLPFGEVLDWQAFSITLEERNIPQLKRILVSIPETNYTSMQSRLKHVRKHFLWHFRSPVKYDVFHMILHSLWLRRLASL